MDIFVQRIDGTKGFTIIGNKTDSDKGFFSFHYVNPYPSNMPKVGEQWNLKYAKPYPVETDLGDFEYVADATPFTITE